MLITVVLATLLIGAGAAFGQKQEFTGTVVGVGGQMGGKSWPFTLSLEHFTSESEAKRAIAVLAEGHQDALLKEISGKKLGYFSISNGLGRDVNFAWQTPTADGGRRITVVFERWMNLFEVRSGTRSQDYPFSYIEINLDRSGKGDGTFIPAAKIYFDKNRDNQVDVENFGIYPARLAGVELRRSRDQSKTDLR